MSRFRRFGDDVARIVMVAGFLGATAVAAPARPINHDVQHVVLGERTDVPHDRAPGPSERAG